MAEVRMSYRKYSSDDGLNMIDSRPRGKTLFGDFFSEKSKMLLS